MATKVSRQKDLLYHHADFVRNTGKTLQEHLEAAWTALPYAADREEKFGEDGENVRLWNKRVKRGLMICGMFHSYEVGRSELVIQVKERVAEYPIVATDPPEATGATDTEFNEGLLFFGVHKNHVLVLQSSALRVSAFEEYLTWLLRDAVDQIGKDNQLALQPTLPRRVRRPPSPLKSIVLSPTLRSEPIVTQPRSEDSGPKIKQMKMRVDHANWGWLRQAMVEMGGDVPNELRLDSDFNPERIQVNIELKWLGRDKDRDETPVLDTIMWAFRDVDDPPIKAVTATGEVIHGHDLKLRRSVSVQVDGKIPIPSDVFEQMQKYLVDLLDRGDVPAE